MQVSPQSASISPLARTGGSRKGCRLREDQLYPLMTIAAMLLVLLTVWVF